MKKICIYHGNCADGFGAAMAVRSKYGEDKVDFHPGVYQNPPPDVTGREVIMVDFSYKRDVLIDMASKAKSILILDHHKSAMDDLVDLPANVEAHFDMERSGAKMAWDYFHPDIKTPPLVLHIQDRDLWQFKLPGTREIQAAVFSYQYDFRMWESLFLMDVKDLRKEGHAIERKHFKDINELLGVVTRDMVIAGYRVPIANLPYTLTSDAGHELAKGKPFAGCYWDTPEGRVFSLRSNDDGIDVAEVAKKYGGGGHRNASGFRVSFKDAQGFEIK